MAPLPDAPKLTTLTTAEPIDTLGVCVHQLVAKAGSVTADNANEAAAAKTLRREMELKRLRMNAPVFGLKFPCALCSAVVFFTSETASVL
ncbi:hypothetical protein [Dyella sp. 2HG41-7]|uniref:hypothetical protein n=1 Tax=Dyella sp. 2HG41-7 TaxID=2883239 RepID=UPI001F1E6008|nr:hypothetical protein [Dyella sp. 2HG41-7]